LTKKKGIRRDQMDHADPGKKGETAGPLGGRMREGITIR